MRDVFLIFSIFSGLVNVHYFFSRKKKQKLETHDSGAMLPAVASLGKI